jgi:hypothetical protein
MTAQVVEYILRVRIEEPVGLPAAGESGEAMALLLSEIEAVAIEQEIISRAVLDGPDTPSLVRCAARSLDPTRHYATGTRYTLTTPSDDVLTTCSAACALSWLCREGLPADLKAAPADPSARTCAGEAA